LAVVPFAFNSEHLCYSAGVIRVIALVAAIFLLAGCKTYRDPSIDVVSATIANTTSEGSVIDFVLDLENPNHVPLRLIDVDYSVWVNGQRVFSGTRSAEASLPPSEQQQIRIPAVAPASVGAPASFSISGAVKYSKPGELARILRDMGLPSPRAGFNGQGNVAAERLAQSE
jgi:hypothetical protein